MNICRILFVAALASVSMALTAGAQVSVYGMVTGERMGGIGCTDTSKCAVSDGTVKPYGGTFGAGYDFKTIGPMRLGADVRGSVLGSNKAAAFYQGGTSLIRHYSLLGGVRGTFRTPYKAVQPYVQISAGLGRTNATYTAPVSGVPSPLAYRSFTQVQGFAGIDIAILPVLDFRVIELGAGEMFGPSSHGVQSIGAGLVFHMSRGD